MGDYTKGVVFTRFSSVETSITVVIIGYKKRNSLSTYVSVTKIKCKKKMFPCNYRLKISIPLLLCCPSYWALETGLIYIEMCCDVKYTLVFLV